MSELSLLYGFKNYSKISDKYIWVPKDVVWDFWKDCISRTEHKFTILSYASNEETWHLHGWREFALAIQEERLKNGCRIERLFCLETNKEKDELNNEMMIQKNIGIDVGYFLKKNLLNNKLVKKYSHEIGTLDVALIDDSWVMRGHLDNKRSFTGASASRDEELLKRVSFIIIREAQKISHKI